MFCGEAEQPQTFISETSYLKVVFHTDNFTDQVSFGSMVCKELIKIEIYDLFFELGKFWLNNRSKLFLFIEILLKYYFVFQKL